MIRGRIRVGLAPLGTSADRFFDRCSLASAEEPTLTLGRLLTELPALANLALTPDLLAVPVGRLRVERWDPAGEPAYLPPGLTAARLGPSADTGTGAATAESVTATAEATEPVAGEPVIASEHPEEMDDGTAVRIAHDVEIRKSAAYLDSGLSVLIRCDKLLVEHLAGEIAGRSGRRVHIIGGETTAQPVKPAGMAGMMAGHRQEVLAALQVAVRGAKANDVIVVPHLDLLAGGSDAALGSEARELTDVLYERSDCVLLGFVDPSLLLPEVLANRFAVRLGFDILPREVAGPDGRIPIGHALITRAEAATFDGLDATVLYKHIAGFNAVRFRHAVRFAHHQHRHKPSRFDQLVAELRTFKAATSTAFEVPNVSFDEIGGYDDVRRELFRALRLLSAADALPDRVRNELVPRGFIFHGPPGTGKTLFAKATANALNATILVVSGPEVTDMYVGESERKVREIFSEARRNAPAVIVFDEFDSIAGQRSGRNDGGSRAGNAIVAQLLTELDGFRPEVPVLVIGTTNRLDIVDEALLRPSRFRPVRIDLPDLTARRAIARVHATHFDVSVSEQLLDRIAIATDRMNGDEIRSVFRDARADELIGDPPRPADARRLGELIGALRRTTQDREMSRGQHGDQLPRQRDTAVMVTLDTRRPEAPQVTADASPAEEDTRT